MGSRISFTLAMHTSGTTASGMYGVPDGLSQYLTVQLDYDESRSTGKIFLELRVSAKLECKKGPAPSSCTNTAALEPATKPAKERPTTGCTTPLGPPGVASAKDTDLNGDLLGGLRIRRTHSDDPSSSTRSEPVILLYMASTSLIAVSKCEVGSNDSEMKTLSSVPSATGTMRS